MITLLLSSFFVPKVYAYDLPRHAQGACEARECPGISISLAAGPGTPSPLHELLRVKKTKIVPQWNSTLALNQRLFQSKEWIALETEAQFSQYFDSKKSQSVQAALILRWLDPPWNKLHPSTFAAGMGPSYAFRTPELEEDLDKQSHVLLHLLFEYTANLTKSWDLLFRVQHRSGVFGAVGEVSGGSDYLCLGARHFF